MGIRPRSFLVAAAVSSVLALAACGGGSDDASTTRTPSPAASSTTTENGADTGSATGSGDPGSADVDSLSALVTRSIEDGKSAHVTLDMGSQGTGEGDVRFSGDSPAMRLSLDMSGRKSEMRLVDGTVYMAAPGRDGKFLRMDVGDAGSALGVDPSQAIQKLVEDGADAKDLGGGHWQLTKDGATTDLYAGDDGFLRRIEVDGGDAGTYSMTFSDWGEEVDVEAPSAADVMRMPGT